MFSVSFLHVIRSVISHHSLPIPMNTSLEKSLKVDSRVTKKNLSFFFKIHLNLLIFSSEVIKMRCEKWIGGKALSTKTVKFKSNPQV